MSQIPTQPTSPEEPFEVKEPKRGPFPVVGIGASAGGLQAFRQLLEHLPSDTGMAFVLIPHLDPSHESAMSEILGRSTSMPVKEVQGEITAEPNHVYVISPNTMLGMSGDKLQVAPRGGAPGKKQECIDFFLSSLAEQRRDRAIGVILSGTADDGTIGVQAIKSEGGITFAQDASAQFHEMPQNAIRSGSIDYVLPPQGIAEELARFSRHPYLVLPAHPAPVDSPQSSGAAKILRLLRGATGVDFSQYKLTTIHRRMARRMALRKLEDWDSYVQFLENNPEEVRVLHDDILINVTSFFREPEGFEMLKRQAFPGLLKDRDPQDPIRVWVPGCSTREEAYSVGMILLEFMQERGVNPEIQIFATDVSERAVERARAGHYANGIRADVPPERLRRFFTPKEGGGYVIGKSLRDICVFARQDLTRDPPFSRLDLLVCRNVLIYLGPALQRRVIPLFHYALKPAGVLFLGSSESVDAYAHLFTIIDKKYKIYSKKESSHAQHYDFATERFQRQAEAMGGAEAKAVSPEGDFQKEVDRVLLTNYVPASVVVSDDGQVVQIRGDTSPYLRPSPGKPSHSLLKMAREELVVYLEAALREAGRTGTRARQEHIRFTGDGRPREVGIRIIPVKSPKSDQRHFVILFEEPSPSTAPESRPQEVSAPVPVHDHDQEMIRLKQELAASREYQQSIIEKLESANEELRSSGEEILSSNEELQSTNEELETSKEELQSSNEELTTVNDELQLKNDELGQLNSDLANVFGVVNLPIVIVDRNLRLRRFNQAAEKLLNITPSDVNRRITDFKPRFAAPNLDELLSSVQDTLTPVAREVQDAEGKWHSLQVRPYRTVDSRIEGAIMTLTDINAVKSALDVSEVERGFLSDLVSTVRDPFLALDSKLRVLMANQSFYTEFQVSKQDTENRLLFELANGQWDIPALRELLERIIPEKGSFFDFKVEREFERIGRRTLLLNACLVRTEADKPPQVLLGIEDVTRRMREMESAFLATVVRSSQDAILTKTLDGIITTCNHGAQVMFGYSAEELLGKPGTMLIPPERQAEEAEILDKLSRGESVGPLETVRRRRDGSLIDISLAISPIKEGSGRIIGASTTARDITEQTLLAEGSKILGSSLDIETTLRNLANLLLGRLADWCFIHVRDAKGGLRRVVSAHREPGSVRAVHEMIDRHPTKPGLERRLLNVLRTGQSELHAEIPDAFPEEAARGAKPLAFPRSLGFKSALIVPLVARESVLGVMALAHAGPHRRRYDRGNLAWAEELGRRAGVAIDNAQLLEQAQEAVHAREEFLSIASHELKTPLTSLQLQLEAALRKLGKDKSASSLAGSLTAMVGTAKEQGERLTDLINTLLDVSRVTSGKLKLEPIETDLAKVVRNVVRQFESVLEEKGQALEVQAKDPVWGQWDPSRLEQVVTNLISNALKYGAGKPIRVVVEGDAEQGRVRVKDRGIGMEPRFLSRIFQPFEQIAAGKGGLGLGLFITRQIVEAHGGAIRVKSVMGKGSTFSVVLPRQFGGGRAVHVKERAGLIHSMFPIAARKREGL